LERFPAISGAGSSDPIPESIFKVLCNHWWVIVGAVVVTLIGGIVYLLQSVPIYMSTSCVYVEQSGPRIMDNLEERNMMRSLNHLQTQAGLFSKTPIVSEALTKHNLASLKTFSGVDNPVAYLKQSIQATVGSNDGFIYICFSGPHANENAEIVNAVVDAYHSFHSERKGNTSFEVLEILQKEKSEISKELSQKNKDLLDFSSKQEGLVLLTEQKDRLSHLFLELGGAQSVVVQTKMVYEGAKKLVDNPNAFRQYIQSLQGDDQTPDDESESDQFINRQVILQQQRADRLRKLQADHPAIQSLDEEILHVQHQMSEQNREFIQTQLALLELKYQAAQENETRISHVFELQREKVVTLDKQNDDLNLRSARRDQLLDAYDLLNNRLKELNVINDVGFLDISIMEVACAGDRPIFPEKRRILTLALILGLVVGGSGAFLKDIMDSNRCTHYGVGGRWIRGFSKRHCG
jgi:polysaccharide biosynthesis transport protein